jgi:hypothetical protein
MDQGPIFIGGLSRSGKTLMSVLLSSHPNIAIPSKGSNMWTHFYRRHGDLSQSNDFERCLAALLCYKHVLALNPDPDRIREEFWQGEPTYARLFALFHMHYAEQLGKQRWGYQSRLVERYTDHIFAAYTGARMIHMVRDPRDRYADDVARLSRGRGKIGGGTARWLYSIGLAKRNLKQYADYYKIVRYETLVAQPEETTRDVCTFLDEDYIHNMLVMESSLSFRDAGGNRSDGKDGRGNISAAFLGGYHQVMSKGEIAFMQTYAKQDMVSLNYKLVSIQFPRGDRSLFFLVDWFINLARMIGWRTLEAVRLRFPAQMGCDPPPYKVQDNE